MNSNEYPPKFKKSKRPGYNKERTGYNKEQPPPKKLAPSKKEASPKKEAPKQKADNTSKSSSIKKSIKKALSSAIEYVKSFKRKSKKDINNEELQESTIIFEENKLDILENEMVHMVENVKEEENDTTEDNILNKFGDIIKNFTIELHNAIGYTEQTNEIALAVNDRAKTNEQANEIALAANEHDQNNKNFNELNNILNFLADNIFDGSKKKKELSFNKSKATYTIRVVSLGIAVSYSTLEEFFDKIANRAGTVKTLCWVARCPEKFMLELKNFIEQHNASQKDYDKILKIFKKMVDAYLNKTYPDVHTKIVDLISSTSGGKKITAKKPKKITAKKPKKITAKKP